MAISTDGVSWVKEDQPVLDIRENNWDNSYIAANGAAINLGNKIYYYYQGVNSDLGYSEIGLAISSDSKHFDSRTDTAVIQCGNEGEWDCHGVADPYVFSFGGNLYMYYLGMDELNIQRLGVAKSTDGKNWIKYKNNPIMDVGVKGAFDENGLGEPSVIYKAPYFYMLYTGRNILEQRNIGVAISLDGVNWKKLNYDGIFNLNENSWDNQVICDTTILENENGNYTVWYGGGNVAEPAENLNGKIGSFEIAFEGVDDATKFDPNNWQNELISSTDFVHGSYAIEGEEENKSVWVADDVNLVLSNDKTMDKVIIKGYVNMELLNQAGITEQKFDFYLNGKKVHSEAVKESGIVEFELDKKMSDDFIIIEIKTSGYVNPSKEGIGGDQRKLSWMLRLVEQE